LGKWDRKDSKTVQRKHSIKFEINERGTFVSVVFYRPIETGIIVPNGAEKILDYQEKITVEYLKENQRIDIYTAQKFLDIKERRAREILSNLVKKNVLTSPFLHSYAAKRNTSEGVL